MLSAIRVATKQFSDFSDRKTQSMLRARKVTDKTL